MTNLIQYIAQEDPEEELKKQNKNSTFREQQEGYRYNPRNLIEKGWMRLSSNKAQIAEPSNIKADLTPKPIGNTAASYKIAQNTKVNTANDVSSYKLGTLSGVAESENGKKLFNDCKADRTGGCSYGTYQIATGPGTMKDYLNYMKNKEEYRDFYNALQQAGGFDAAKSGTDAFKSTWKKLSQDSKFLDSQHNFMLKNNYNPAIEKIKYIKGLNLDKRSPVVGDSVFSTAVQFGGNGAANLIYKALGNDVSKLRDEDIINKIYDERGYKKYFKSSSEDIQKSVKKNRSVDERQRALELLLKYPN